MLILKQLQRDPDICANCYRRTHTRFERNYRIERDADGTQWLEEVNLPDEVLPIAQNTAKIPNEASGLKTICKCGYQYKPRALRDEDETWKNRPLTKSLFFGYADNLIDRVFEEGYDIDEATYWDELRDLKSDPDRQFADDRLFARAINRAVDDTEPFRHYGQGDKHKDNEDSTEEAYRWVPDDTVM